jgi:photosystem II stability/assembly factor-like uncharacterized protein
MKKKFMPALLLFFFCTKTLFAQEFLNRLPQGDSAVTLLQLEQAFNEWAKGKNLSKEKGWKLYKRWEYENRLRSGSDRDLPDAAVYLSEMINASEAKKQLAGTGKNSSAGWVPVGPVNLPPSPEPGSQHGMGRINCVAFHPTDPNTLWVGVAQGGVWKSTDNGTSWTPLTDDLPILRISDIAVDPLRPDTMYISVCDFEYIGFSLKANGRKRNTHYGLGIYKTTDGGNTWNPTGLSFNLADLDGSLIRRVLVNPSSPDDLVAAGVSGVWRSSDGGNTWTKKLDSLIWDMEPDPSNINILYAASGFVNTLKQGTAGILKSTDFGNTWVKLNTGIPGKSVQRIKLAIAPSDPNYIYALACNTGNGFYGLYRSVNAGSTWSQRSNSPNILEWDDGGANGGQGTYDLALLVDPSNRNKIYTGGVNMWGSTDGGSTWNGVSHWTGRYGPSIHADQHYLSYNALSKKIYMANDGGIFYTDTVKMGSWTSANNDTSYKWPTKWTDISSGMQISSFYRIGLSANNTGVFVAGAQDNSTTYKFATGWFNVVGGDGMEGMVHPDDPNVIYGSSQYGSIDRSDDGGYNFTYITPSHGEMAEWTTPIVMHPGKPDTIYAGFGNVWRSFDKGTNWNPISNFANMPGAGDPAPISALAIAESNPNYIYVAKRVYYSYSQPGEIWKTINGGGNWTKITASLPDSLYFTYLAIDSDDPNTVWITCAGLYPGLKVFKTTNGGSTWTNISYNLPNLPVNCVAHQKGTSDNTIYIGTDAGVFYINDNLTSWQPFSTNLPNVIVSELEIHYLTNKLFAATFGRGVWETDLPVSTFTKNISSSAPWNLSAYPDKNAHSLSIEITGAEAHAGIIEVIDITGKKVFSEPISLSAGTFRKEIVFNFPSGVYFVRAWCAEQSKVLKVVW